MVSKKSILAGILSATILAGMTASFAIPPMMINATYIADSISPADLNVDGLNISVRHISLSEGLAIDQAITKSVSANLYDSAVESVELRDWNSYISDYTQLNLPANVKTLCNRFDEIFKYYLEHNDIDATYVNSLGNYFCNGATYSDLGMTEDEAIDVAMWFLYTHPQYYYIKPSFATTEKSVYIACYDSLYKGSVRAGVTNDLFDQIDAWVDEATDTEVSTYQIEMSAHDILCDHMSYSKNSYDQSVYSAVFNDGKSACVGYSSAFSMIMNAADIQTLIGVSATHAWNLVQLDDDAWYGVDVTWDDSLGGKYLFNCGTSSFYRMDGSGESHIYIDMYSDWYPVMAADDYVPSTYDLTGEEYDEETYQLDKPYNITSDQINGNSYRLTWSDIPNAKYYDVEVYEDDVLISTLNIDTNTLRLSNINTTKSLYVKIRACGSINNTACYSDWTVFKFDLPIEQPVTPVKPDVDRPTNLVVSEATANRVRLAWDDMDGISGYDVSVYGDAGYTDLINSAVVTTNTLRLTAIQNAQTLYVRVRAFIIADSERYYSDYADITVNIQAEPNPPVDPGTTEEPDEETVETEETTEEDPDVDEPENFEVKAKTSTSVVCTWDEVDGADCYDAKICSDAAGNNIIASIRTQGTRVNLTKLSNNKTYYLFVRAVDKDTIYEYTSDWTSVSFKISDLIKKSVNPVTPVDPVKPTAPAVKVLNASKSSKRLSWGSVDSARYYEIEVYSNKDCTKRVTNLTLSDVSMKLTCTKTNVSYFVRVRAVNGSNKSDWTLVEVKF